jgi:hypothetical protein
MRASWTVAGQAFRTQRELQEHVRRILYACPLGGCLAEPELAFMSAFFARHERADQKIGPGIASIEVVPDSFGGRRFQITRVDGTSTDISIEKCLRQSSPEARFRDTCRRAVAEQIIAFKVAQRPGLGASRELHVDHIPPLTFKRLVSAFIAARQIDVRSVTYVDDGDNYEGQRFADRSLERDWQEYHQRRAQLRVISAQQNLRTPRKAVQP